MSPFGTMPCRSRSPGSARTTASRSAGSRRAGRARSRASRSATRCADTGTAPGRAIKPSRGATMKTATTNGDRDRPVVPDPQVVVDRGRHERLRAVREVEDTRRLVREHEPDREQRVDAAVAHADEHRGMSSGDRLRPSRRGSSDRDIPAPMAVRYATGLARFRARCTRVRYPAKRQVYCGLSTFGSSAVEAHARLARLIARSATNFPFVDLHVVRAVVRRARLRDA